MENHIPEHEQRIALNDINAEALAAMQSRSGVDGNHTGQSRQGHGDSVTGPRDSTARQNPARSPFSTYQPEQTHSASPRQSDDALHSTAKDRWQKAGKRIAEKGPIRFDDTPALSSDDTAHTNSGLNPPLLERKSSLFARSSTNLSKLSKSFTDNRAGNTAMAETVRLAQQQQQANRQSAAPVLKAVPSTRASVKYTHSSAWLMGTGTSMHNFFGFYPEWAARFWCHSAAACVGDDSKEEAESGNGADHSSLGHSPL